MLICLFRYRWDGKKWGRKNTWDWWKIQDPNRVTAVVTLTPPAGKLRSIIFPLMWLIYFQDCRHPKSRCTRLHSCWWITVSHVSVITSPIPTILQKWNWFTFFAAPPARLFNGDHVLWLANSLWNAVKFSQKFPKAPPPQHSTMWTLVLLLSELQPSLRTLGVPGN